VKNSDEFLVLLSAKIYRCVGGQSPLSWTSDVISWQPACLFENYLGRDSILVTVTLGA